jgi:hypothetical protein
MPAVIKLLIFWLILFGLIVLLFRFSHTKVVGLLFTWHGPMPTEGETLSRYYARRATWVFGLLGQSLIILAGLVVLIRWQPNLTGGPVEFVGMLVPVIAFMLLVCTVRYVFLSAKAKFVGPNPTVPPPEHEVEV